MPAFSASEEAAKDIDGLHRLIPRLVCRIEGVEPAAGHPERGGPITVQGESGAGSASELLCGHQAGGIGRGIQIAVGVCDLYDQIRLAALAGGCDLDHRCAGGRRCGAVVPALAGERAEIIGHGGAQVQHPSGGGQTPERVQRLDGGQQDLLHIGQGDVRIVGVDHGGRRRHHRRGHGGAGHVAVPVLRRGAEDIGAGSRQVHGSCTVIGAVVQSAVIVQVGHGDDVVQAVCGRIGGGEYTQGHFKKGIK